MVRVEVGEKLQVDPAERNFELIEPDGGAATGVDEELAVAGLDQRARTEALGARDRHPGPEQRHAEAAPAHELILMPASLMTLAQRTVSARTKAPNSAGVPPPTSVPILASESRTFSVTSPLFT